MPWKEKKDKLKNYVKNKLGLSGKKKLPSSENNDLQVKEAPEPTGDKNQLLLTDKKHQVLRRHQPRGAEGGISFENPHYDPPVSEQKEYAAAVNQQAEPDLQLGACGPDISNHSQKKYRNTPPQVRKTQKRRSKEQLRPSSSVRGSQVLESVDEDSISNATSRTDLRQEGTRYKLSHIEARQGFSGDEQRLRDQNNSKRESLQRYAKSEDILSIRRSSGYESWFSENRFWQSLETLTSSMETLTDRVSQLESSYICSNCSSMTDMRDNVTAVRVDVQDLQERMSNTCKTLHGVKNRLREVEITTEDHDEKLYMELRQRKANHHSYDADSEEDDGSSHEDDRHEHMHTNNIGDY